MKCLVILGWEKWGKEPYPTPSLISDSRKIAFPIHLACRLGLWLFLHTIYTGDIEKIFKHAIIEISSRHKAKTRRNKNERRDGKNDLDRVPV